MTGEGEDEDRAAHHHLGEDVLDIFSGCLDVPALL